MPPTAIKWRSIGAPARATSTRFAKLASYSKRDKVGVLVQIRELSFDECGS